MAARRMERRVGIRELKAKLSECIHEVRNGSTIVVTEHGRPVVRMIPEDASLQERLTFLVQAGVISWSGRPLKPMKPVARIRGRKTVADLVSENRD
jgi:prevent-host-death family protein